MKNTTVCLLVAILIITSSAVAFAANLRGNFLGIKTVNDVVYARVGDRELHMDLALPAAKSDKPLPVIVWIHGGGWKAGSYKPNRAAVFAKDGYITASIEYRLSNEAIFPAQIQDCKAAIRYLRANATKYNINPNKIGVWGGSAGGHLAALLGTTYGNKELEGNYGNTNQSSKVQAVCDFYGPVDLTASQWKHDPQKKKHGPLVELLGGTPAEKPDLAKLASPIYHITKDDAPTLIVHGDADEMVPFSQSEEFYNALKKAGVYVELIKVKGGGHGLTTEGQSMSMVEIYKAVLAFFDKQLKNR